MATPPAAAVTADLSETEQRNLRAVADVLPFRNRQDISGVLAFYDERITRRNVALEETYQGKAAVRAFLVQLFASFRDLNFEGTHKVGHGNNVAEQWTIRGTHSGTFLGVLAGRAVRRQVIIDVPGQLRPLPARLRVGLARLGGLSQLYLEFRRNRRHAAEPALPPVAKQS